MASSSKDMQEAVMRQFSDVLLSMKSCFEISKQI